MEKKSSKALKDMVEEGKCEMYKTYEILVEKYVRMSERKLADYLANNPKKILCDKFAIPIEGINLKEEQIKLGSVITATKQQVEDDFIDPEKLTYCDIFWKNTIPCTQLLPFFNLLRNRGFEPKLSEVIGPLEMVYPFFG